MKIFNLILVILISAFSAIITSIRSVNKITARLDRFKFLPLIKSPQFYRSFYINLLFGSIVNAFSPLLENKILTKAQLAITIFLLVTNFFVLFLNSWILSENKQYIQGDSELTPLITMGFFSMVATVLSVGLVDIEKIYEFLKILL